MFSYGSGLASSMFSLTVKGDFSEMKDKLDLVKRLENRTDVEPEVFEASMKLREEIHNMKSYVPKGVVAYDGFFKGTFYLQSIDEMFRRSYSIVE